MSDGKSVMTVTSGVVFSNAGTTPAKPSAGQAVTVIKAATGVVTSVHGTISGVTTDNPA